jgi:O-antigen/teichoic acid export membrane protein
MSLKQKAFSGIIWKFVEQMSKGILGFGIGIVLARLLTPSDYGLIGMLAIFIALSTTIIDSGFDAALIQKRDRTEQDLNTVFWFNIFISSVCYIVLFFCAPLIAVFYSKPVLVQLLRVLGLNLIINSFNAIQQTQLTIKIDFKTTTKVSFTSSIAGGVIGIIMAYTGFGVWALVAQSVTSTIFSSIVLWVSSKWRPAFMFSFASLKGMFKYGSKLLFSAIYAIVLNNLYNIIIGRVYQAKELGIYTRAYQLPELISGTLNSVINSVTFPLLSSINHDRERMVSAYSKMLSMTAFIIFPAMTLIAILSHPFVEVLLTKKWIAIVPLMQYLCFARMMTPISALNLNILKASGRSDLFLWTDLSKVPLVVLNMIITIPMGIKYIAIGSVIVTIISYFINAYIPGKKFGYGAMKQIKDCSKIIIAVLIMSAVTVPLLYIIQNQILLLITGGGFGIFIYISIAYVLKIQELTELELAFKGVFQKMNKR